jgi:RNA polymerase sigma-70 factor (sigma-E family)
MVGRVEPNRRLRCLEGMTSLTGPAGVSPIEARADEWADVETFDDIYRRCRPGLLRLAHLLTGSPTLAEDVVHDAFVGLARRTRRVDEPMAYLRRSVVNLSTNIHRRAQRERRYLKTLTDAQVEPVDVDETWQLVKQLPPRQRTVLVLRFYLDLSEAEVARVMGCRPGTVKSSTARALAKLKEQMS